MSRRHCRGCAASNSSQCRVGVGAPWRSETCIKSGLYRKSHRLGNMKDIKDMAENHDDSLGIEVILPEGGKPAPCCPHGPTLLFEKVSKGEGTGRRFYACSACRDRKDCSFFQWEDDKVSEVRLLAREAENKSKKPPVSHKEYCARFKKFASLRPDEQKFCQDCQTLLPAGVREAHASHRLTGVTAAQLKRPSVLLRPLDNKKSNAQYLFTDRSAHFLLDTLAGLGYTKVLCMGTPRLQELIKLRNLEQNHEPMKSLLLDIDFSLSSAGNLPTSPPNPPY
ncbi:unnamed protein product [Pleuronectes platessa]|uniref:GRF-type domain-containing protein n=1 Tax=Pleuronectes platessa TaxID=8262 RepID=A0A9N7TJJ5_PLEPL|nr:unnamed protein product [Pleuronectes platessa]